MLPVIPLDEVLDEPNKASNRPRCHALPGVATARSRPRRRGAKAPRRRQASRAPQRAPRPSSFSGGSGFSCLMLLDGSGWLRFHEHVEQKTATNRPLQYSFLQGAPCSSALPGLGIRAACPWRCGGPQPPSHFELSRDSLSHRHTSIFKVVLVMDLTFPDVSESCESSEAGAASRQQSRSDTWFADGFRLQLRAETCRNCRVPVPLPSCEQVVEAAWQRRAGQRVARFMNVGMCLPTLRMTTG